MARDKRGMAERIIVVAAADAGQTMAAILKARLNLSWSAVRRLVEQRRVRLQGSVCLDPNRRLSRGQRLQVGEDEPVPKEFDGAQPVVRYVDDQIVVVEKPPGLTTMRHTEEAAEFGARAGRFLPSTLADRLPSLLAARTASRPGPIRPVHRLDKDTSGLVVFARTVDAERHLGKQFRAHTIERRYLAIVRGQARNARRESRIVRDRGDGRRGSTSAADGGQVAVTNVRVVEALGDFTLVECRLETGRTHQVRIHLAESGTPICGERVYDRPVHGRPLPDLSGVKRLALHAASLGFVHPRSGKRLTWESPLPADMKALLARLRQSG